MRSFILIVFLGGLGLAAAALGAIAWRSAGDAEISLLGWIAMAAGVVATVLVGGGLMALVFYSSRSGHDDNQYSADERGDGDDDRSAR